MEVSRCRHRNKAESLELEETHLKQKVEEEISASRSVEEYLTKHYEVTMQTDRQMPTPMIKLK